MIGTTRAPRLRPGTRREIGLANAGIARVLGIAAGTGPPALFTTLARNRGLFRRWLLFASGLMPGGRLPRRDTELVILRVAHLCDCAYEWEHHVRLGRRAGLTPADLARVVAGPDAEGWTEREAALLRAAEELHARDAVAEDTWRVLERHLSPEDLIELCLLAGHYVMLAGALNSMGIPPDEPRGRRR